MPALGLALRTARVSAQVYAGKFLFVCCISSYNFLALQSWLAYKGVEYLQKSNYNKIPTSEIRTVDSDYTSQDSSDDVSQEDDFRDEETATTQEVQRSKAVGNEKLTAAEEERLQSGMRNGWLFIALNICDEFAVCLNRGGLDEVITHNPCAACVDI